MLHPGVGRQQRDNAHVTDGPAESSAPASLVKRGMAVASTLFAFWAIAFIHRTSVVAVDGRRYFVLVDDAMISMRYAWNLSHGNGLVWNPGEYVEGYRICSRCC